MRDLGLPLAPGARVLDFGCGRGDLVAEMRQHGFDTFGCDIELWHNDSEAASMEAAGLLRKIDMNNYVLPFPDNTFDVIFSDQVFEHVQNYPETISELARVLKPSGFCLHVFPSRYTLIEPHVYVPLGSLFRFRAWLRFWAALGVHNEYQGAESSKDGKTAKEIADFNYSFLRTQVNYLPKSTLRREFRARFDDVRFCEREFLKNSVRGKVIYHLSRLIPFIPALFSTFRTRVILTGRPIAQHQELAKPLRQSA